MRMRKALLLLTILGVVLSGSVPVMAAPPKGVLKLAIHFSISADWLDPATGSHSISCHLPLYFFHDALLKPMPEGMYTPGLAESWTVSPDCKVYEFKLREGVKFHNGDTLTADDVVFSFWRYKAHQSKLIHGKTDKVEAVNPNLVRIHFKEPFPDFLEYLLPGATTIGWIVPKKYVEKVGDAGFKRNPVGAGPYKFVDFLAGVRVVGEAFEDYWRKVPSIKRMEFYTVSETSSRVNRVKTGEADIATSIQEVFFAEIGKDPSLRLIKSMSGTRWTVFFTTQWDPKSPWSDLRVRQAASLAIDRKTLADVQSPGSYPIGSIGLKDDPLALQIPPDPYDPEKAIKLLAEAGYPKGFHGGKFYPSEGTFWPYGEQIANYWKAVGITVDTVLLDRPAVTALREGGKMKGGTFVDSVASPTIGGALSYRFVAGSYGNYPEIVDVWEKFKKEVRPSARKDLISRVQELIHEKRMWIPLTSQTSPAVIGPRVKGNPFRIQPHLHFSAPFEDIELVN